ncbi:hypothetical protein NI17_020835 [Thermobifida halotolerans]|uniref:Uncharacterized protein n=1 Tax=Thermobifida halotolerans TaxID=483545 RepID=A0AA97M3P4_9ACTN|nr:hypothetical protein [Thermobifida halotolerans]UOE19172.1 hypothetical protein NI17_020835 [Thermobifida halotolerans]
MRPTGKPGDNANRASNAASYRSVNAPFNSSRVPGVTRVWAAPIPSIR